MRWYGRELTVARGEEFSLSCEITDDNGVPYMISSALPNPTFMLTVANTLYKSDDKRYVLNCWTPLVTKAPTATSVSTLVGATNVSIVYYLTADCTIDNVKYNKYTYYTYNGATWDVYVTYVNGYVFDTFEIGNISNLTDAPSTSERKLYKYTNGKYYIFVDSSWLEYKTIFVQTFSSSITRDWLNKNFYYELRLVAGELTDEFRQKLSEDKLNEYTDNPFDLITDEFVLIPKTQLNVLSRLGGYNNG